MPNEVRFDVVAKDSASKVLDQVADKAEAVEESDPTVTVKADATKANHTVDGFADQLDRLTDADKVVVLALRAGAAQGELRDLATDLATIDARDPDIDVKFARYAEVSGQLEELEGQIKAIGDVDVDVGGGSVEQARTKLQGLGEDADRTKDSVHSMAGNAIGDFAATTSGVGPLGEALGQLSEVALAGEGSLKQLAVAGLGLGAISAGITVLNIVMGKFADAAKKAAEIKAFNEKQVKDYTESVLAAADALRKAQGIELADPIPTGVNKNMQDLASKTQELVGIWEKAGKVEAFDAKSGEIVDMTHTLAEANITAEQWAEAVINGGVAINKLGTEARQAGIDEDGRTKIMQIAADEMVKYDTAQTAAADQTKVFAVATKQATQASKDATQTQKDLDAAARRVTTALDDQSRKLDELRDNVADDQAWVDLQTAFDQVRDSAKTAWDAAKTGAEGASTAVRQHTTDTNNLKLAIIDYGTKVLGLPTDQVTNIVTHVDDSQLDALERRLETIKRNATINAQIINAGGAGYGPSGGPRSAPVPSLSAAAAPARWARINGR